MNHQSPNFPGTIVEEVAFFDSTDPPRWVGRLRLPGKPRPIDILIFNIEGEFWALPSLCPHQGYNLTYCPLVNGNSLVCPAHSEQIALKTAGFRVKEYKGQFLVFLNEINLLATAENGAGTISGDEDFKTAHQLREEVDQLRLANLKQERQILVITQTMDAMLSESEEQKLKLKEKVAQQQALTRFVDSIMNTMDDLLFVIDKNGLILRLNATVERELGFTEAELLGTLIDDLLPATGQHYLAGQLPVLPWPVRPVLLETIRLNGHYSGEHALLGKSGGQAKIRLLAEEQFAAFGAGET